MLTEYIIVIVTVMLAIPYLEPALLYNIAWSLPILTYVDLIIYSLVLSGLAQLLFNLFFSINMLLLWIWCVICWLEKDEGTYLLTACSYVELQFFTGLIGFIHMTQLNICALLISAILKHLTDLNVVG